MVNYPNKRYSAQKGFTLIELVIVIVILGILSAFALPRFADLGGDARAASIEGAAGAMRSASSIVRSACLASSDCNTNDENDTIDLEGQTVELTYGYPEGNEKVVSPGGILLAAQITADDYSVSADAGVVTVTLDGTDDGQCQITYDEADDQNSAPDISVDVANC